MKNKCLKKTLKTTIAAKLSVSWVELFLRSPRFPGERSLSLSLSIFTFHIVPWNTKLRNMKGI